jgi:uncharacterized protein YegJ (DUF2314 family)
MNRLIIALLGSFMIIAGAWAAEEETTQAQTQTAGPAAKPPAGHPGYAHCGDNDKEMERAVENAQRSLGFFMAALRAHKNGDGVFEIKKAFVDGDKVEHIWIRGVTYDGKRFHGKVDNQPVEVNNTHLGQHVTVAPQEVDDWSFVKDGKLIGAYTTRVLYARLTPEEKAEYDKQAQPKAQ